MSTEDNNSAEFYEAAADQFYPLNPNGNYAFERELKRNLWIEGARWQHSQMSERIKQLEAELAEANRQAVKSRQESELAQSVTQDWKNYHSKMTFDRDRFKIETKRLRKLLSDAEWYVECGEAIQATQDLLESIREALTEQKGE